MWTPSPRSPVLSAMVGAMIGSLLNATLTARAAKRELEEADDHDLLRRVRELELKEARRQGRDDTERNRP
jgi:hypothetical protein